MIKEYLKLSREVWLYFIACVLFSIGSGIIPFLILLLTNEFNYSPSQSGLIFCIIMIVLIPASLIGGNIANIYNKKKSLVIMRFFYAICLLFYINTNLNIAKLMLLIMAIIFIAVSSPILNSIVLDMVPENHARKAYSLVYMGENIGSIIAPLITGAIFNEIQLLFIIYSISAIIACIIIILYIPYRINENGEKSQKNTVKSTRLNKKSILRKNSIIICIFLSFIGYEFCYAQQSFSLPIEMEYIFKTMGAKYYGYITSYNSVLVLILTPIITLITKKITPINAIIISGLFCSIGFGMLYYSGTLLSIFILVTCWTIGEVLYSINSFIALSKLLNKGESGTASAFILMSRSIGMSTCSIFSSLLIQIQNISIVWIATVIISFLATILIWSSKNKRIM